MGISTDPEDEDGGVGGWGWRGRRGLHREDMRVHLHARVGEIPA